MYIFLFGVILPAGVTLTIFVIFLICWFKCNLREKCFSNKTKKNKTDLDSSSQEGSVYSIESDNNNGVHYPKGVKYPIKDYSAERKKSLDTHSIHIYDTLDYVDMISEISYQTANSGQRMIGPYVHGRKWRSKFWHLRYTEYSYVPWAWSFNMGARFFQWYKRYEMNLILSSKMWTWPKT